MASPIRFIAAVALAAAAPAFAGSVDVSFTDADHYLDAGNSPVQQQSYLNTLSGYLQSLGRRYLPAGQALKLEVLDVDLAGYSRPNSRGQDLRILRNGADWPRIVVRYTLQEQGRVLSQGEETIADMDYMHHMADRSTDVPLGHEKHMLDEWFRARFAHGRRAD
jgi:hypothetical protein